MSRFLSRLVHHARYLLHALGRRRVVGDRHLRMHGYFPNKFCASDDHEPHLDPILRRLLAARRGAFVDVGANVGQTLVKVLAIAPDRRYVGFEPQIECCFYIDRFLHDNDLRQAAVFPLCLGERTGFVTLRGSGNVDLMATTDLPSLPPRAGLVERTVAVMRGDDALSGLELDGIAVVKIDVEGAEIEVLRGLEQTLRRERPALLVEVLPNYHGAERTRIDPLHAAARRERAEQILTMLGDLGYSLFQIDLLGATRELQRFDLDDPASFVSSDYLALPRDENPAVRH